MKDSTMGDIFRQRLKDEMHEKNIRQVDICNKTGIPKAALHHYLSGKANPKQDRLYLIADAIGVDPAWLMGYDVPKTKEIDEIKQIDKRLMKLMKNLNVDNMEEAQEIAQAYLDSDNKTKRIVIYALGLIELLKKYEE